MNFSNIKKIIKSKKAFALSELLISVVIVSFAGLLISEGVVLGTNSFVETSNLSEANILIDDYETAIKNALSNGKFLMDYNEKPLFENKKLNMNGYLDVIDGVIVFVPVKIDYYGNIIKTDITTDLIPRRNMYAGKNKGGSEESVMKYKSDIDYKYIAYENTARYDVTISITKDDKIISSRTFSIYETGEIIKV